MKRNEEKVGNYFAYQVHAYTVYQAYYKLNTGFCSKQIHIFYNKNKTHDNGGVIFRAYH